MILRGYDAGQAGEVSGDAVTLSITSINIIPQQRHE